LEQFSCGYRADGYANLADLRREDGCNPVMGLGSGSHQFSCFRALSLKMTEVQDVLVRPMNPIKEKTWPCPYYQLVDWPVCSDKAHFVKTSSRQSSTWAL
jgi:hypothetical protein